VGAAARRSGGRWAVALVVGMALLGQPALADSGLSIGGRSRYVLNPKATTVQATVTVDLRNTTPSSGGYFYFYNTFAVPVPAGAENVRARSNGSSLSVTLKRTDDPSTRLARVSFPKLLYGRSRTIVLTFEVPGEKPRSRDSTRVGPGYATFAVYGVGDEGRNSVEVVAPAKMSFEATSDDFTSTQKGSTSTHTSTSTTGGEGSWAVVSLRDPERTDEKSVEVNGVSVLLNGFQDDPRWSTFVSGQVTKGIPELEQLVGAKWPGGLERIREDASPSLRGYDGWFDPSDDEIVIGEQLDSDLIFHELSHAWVNGDRFDQRWVSEGLAQVLAERAVTATGGTPYTHPKVSRGSKQAVALNAWNGSAGSRSDVVDAYAYPAAYAATKSLVSGLDDTQLAAVLGAAIRGERAYDPPGTRDTDGGRTSWSRWLDLLETRAGVEAAPKVFSRWVLTGEERATLAARARARTAYAAVDRADGAWLPPEGLRDAMTAWDFDRAGAVDAKVAPLGRAATEVQAAAARAGVEVPDAVRTSYEQAEQDEQYTALAKALPQAATAVVAVGAAERAAASTSNPLSALGATVLGVEGNASRATALLDEGRYPEATSAAKDATRGADRALLVGLAMVGALLLLAAAVFWWVRRFRATQARHRAEQQATLAALATAAPVHPVHPVHPAQATQPGAGPELPGAGPPPPLEPAGSGDAQGSP